MLNLKAFTLVEVLVAATLMLVSVTAILGAVGAYTKVSAKRSGDMTAIIIAQKQVAELRTYVTATKWADSALAPTGNIQQSDGSYSTVPSLTIDPALYSSNPGISGSYSITPDNSGAKKVTVTVNAP